MQVKTEHPKPSPSEDARKVAHALVMTRFSEGNPAARQLVEAIATALQSKQDQIAEAAKVIEKCRVAFDGVGTTESERSQWIGNAIASQNAAAEWLAKHKPVSTKSCELNL